jgi:hypothetical protein
MQRGSLLITGDPSVIITKRYQRLAASQGRTISPNAYQLPVVYVKEELEQGEA